MVIDTRFDLLQYVHIVNDIVDEYFNDSYEYQPHIGMISAMRIFYAECVKESDFDEICPHDTNDIELLEKVLTNEEFIDEYNQALLEVDGFRFNFACAYRDAMDIVEAMKNSHLPLLGKLEQIILGILEKWGQALSEENIVKLQKVSEDIKSGNFDYYQFLQDHSSSAEFQEILDANKEKLAKIASGNKKRKSKNKKKK